MSQCPSFRWQVLRRSRCRCLLIEVLTLPRPVGLTSAPGVELVVVPKFWDLNTLLAREGTGARRTLPAVPIPVLACLIVDETPVLRDVVTPLTVPRALVPIELDLPPTDDPPPPDEPLPPPPPACVTGAIARARITAAIPKEFLHMAITDVLQNANVGVAGWFLSFSLLENSIRLANLQPLQHLEFLSECPRH